MRCAARPDEVSRGEEGGAHELQLGPGAGGESGAARTRGLARSTAATTGLGSVQGRIGIAGVRAGCEPGASQARRLAATGGRRGGRRAVKAGLSLGSRCVEWILRLYPRPQVRPPASHPWPDHFPSRDFRDLRARAWLRVLFRYSTDHLQSAFGSDCRWNFHSPAVLSTRTRLDPSLHPRPSTVRRQFARLGCRQA